MQVTVEVATQNQGSPRSGNGGYVSGLLASYLSPQQAARGVEVTLRAPTPLNVPINLQAESARTAACVGDVLIGEALPRDLELRVPQPPTFAQALAAQPHSPAIDPTIENVVSRGTGFQPVCYCCGADVAVSQGLRVFAALGIWL